MSYAILVPSLDVTNFVVLTGFSTFTSTGFCPAGAAGGGGFCAGCCATSAVVANNTTLNALKSVNERNWRITKFLRPISRKFYTASS